MARLVLALAALSTPRLARACAVCFGLDANAATLGRAYTWGIFILIACTFGILACIVYAMVRIEVQRAEALKALDLGLSRGSRNGRAKDSQEAALRI